MEKSQRSKFAFSCVDCRGGIRHLQYLTYFTWLHDQLITVPNFPAWVCDACGQREYDVRAVSWLNTLLNAPSKRSGMPAIQSPASNPVHTD